MINRLNQNINSNKIIFSFINVSYSSIITFKHEDKNPIMIISKINEIGKYNVHNNEHFIEILTNTISLNDKYVSNEIIKNVISDNYVNQNSISIIIKCFNDLPDELLSFYNHYYSIKPDLFNNQVLYNILTILSNYQFYFQAIDIFEQNYLYNNKDAKIDIKLLNLLLNIYYKTNIDEYLNYKGITDSSPNVFMLTTVNRIINKLKHNRYFSLHHTTFSELQSLFIIHDLLQYEFIIKKLMLSNGIQYSKYIYVNMMNAALLKFDYIKVLQIYNHALDNKILPSAEMMVIITDILIKVDEYAIALRAICNWFNKGGELDWKLCDILSTLVQYKIPSARYNSMNSYDEIELTPTNNDSLYLPITNKVISKNNYTMPYRELKLNLTETFNENIEVFYKNKNYFVKKLSNILVKYLQSSLVSQPNSKLVNNNITTNVSHDLLIQMKVHIVRHGHIDTLIKELKSRNIYDYKSFYDHLLVDYHNSFKSEWRVILTIYERLEYEIYKYHPIYFNNKELKYFELEDFNKLLHESLCIVIVNLLINRKFNSLENFLYNKKYLYIILNNKKFKYYLNKKVDSMVTSDRLLLDEYYDIIKYFE